ncbi:hypothetical protein PILCRDRAFT_105901 [Piloderma croceum F 1598]|uniref:BTB domain-containing protein n=1 Tax=Piloderma croceum (strain F 1598) TaxID=765440 RepID=A0A0C3BZI4_PILCF|nr:hypothetical protein PILCRDRAFT_105901 [Piloderma croceum F 1598]
MYIPGAFPNRGPHGSCHRYSFQNVWQALIMYLYSGDIKFLPLKSQTSSSLFIPPNTIACSPKSMYRLATKMGLHNLKVLALSSIAEGLSKQNIVEEAFSTFTSRYPAIMEMEMDVLYRHYSSPEVLEAFPAKMEKVAMGELPHSAKNLTSLYQKLAERTSATI